MKTRDLLIEIGCEDLPSWSGEYLRENWLPVITSLFEEYRVCYGTLSFFHTVRRLILLVKDVEVRQRDITTEVYGPPVAICIREDGRFMPAAERFAESHGVDAKNLLIKEKKGKKVLVAVKREKGQQVSRIIDKLLRESLKKIEIPRAMRWNSGDFRFIRPVRWVLAIFGDKVVRIKIDGVTSSRYSYGHRILSPSKFSVANPRDYLDKSLKRFVIFDPDVRFEFTKSSLLKKAGDKKISFDQDYLRKITAMAEYPFVEICSLKDEHTNLPDEVVSAVIKKLNGIPLLEEDGKLHPLYAVVFDGLGGDEIRSNYQNVLHAKMEDALFFIKKDMEVDFASYSKQLKNIIYSQRWGSVYDRVERFKKVCDIVFEYLNVSEEEKENVRQIISLCKNDLPTLMVAEFPSLEGVIGRIYAERSGYNRIVSSGIEQHYWPRYSGDELPETREACIVSVIDRLESLCSFLAGDAKVSGAGDPYGLKKLASGLVEIIWKQKMEFPLREVIDRISDIFDSGQEDISDRVTNFILQRAENLLVGEGITPGIRRAVVSVHRDNLVVMREKIDALEQFFKSGRGAQSILVPFIRVANILKQAEEKGLKPQDFDEALLEEKTEKELYEFYRSEEGIRKLIDDKQYERFLHRLSGWKELIDRYFDDVLIMCPDEKLRDNRLALMRKINELFNLFADFSLIPIVEVEVTRG